MFPFACLQKSMYKKTIDQLNHDYHLKTTTQSKQVMALTQVSSFLVVIRFIKFNP